MYQLFVKNKFLISLDVKFTWLIDSNIPFNEFMKYILEILPNKRFVISGFGKAFLNSNREKYINFFITVKDNEIAVT